MLALIVTLIVTLILTLTLPSPYAPQIVRSLLRSAASSAESIGLTATFLDPAHKAPGKCTASRRRRHGFVRGVHRIDRHIPGPRA